MTASPVTLFVFSSSLLIIARITPKSFSRKGPCHLSLYFPQPLGSYPNTAAAPCNFVERIHKKSLPKHMREHPPFPPQGKARFTGHIFYKMSFAKWSNFWMSRVTSDIRKTIREEFVQKDYYIILLGVSWHLKPLFKIWSTYMTVQSS